METDNGLLCVIYKHWERGQKGGEMKESTGRKQQTGFEWHQKLVQNEGSENDGRMATMEEKRRMHISTNQ